MTTIDSVAQLAALIRRRMAESRAPVRAARKDAASSAETGESSAHPMSHVNEETDLASVIARRVQAIDPDDKQRQRKAFRIFLESALLAEWGEQLMNDAGFYQLVEEVHQQMEADAELAGAIQEATKLLLSVQPPEKKA